MEVTQQLTQGGSIVVITHDFDSCKDGSIPSLPATRMPLVYGGKTYIQFLIDTEGNVTNLKTGKTYKKSFRKSCGYLYVYLPLGQRGKTKAIRIHKAVAETFIPNPNNLPMINHIDEDKTNCSITNLEWVTPKENFNKHLDNHKEGNNRKLKKEDVKFILDNRYIIPQRTLAKMFKVARTCIQRLYTRDNYYKNLREA